MSPENTSEGLYSTKSDVLSFGVSRKRNRGFNHPNVILNLLESGRINQYLSNSLYKRSAIIFSIV